MTAPAIRPVLWSGSAWADRIRPETRLLRGRAYEIAKRCLDLSLVIATSPLWVPLMLLCALLVKLDSPRHPVFFSQLRAGKGGRTFRMYKFRTMVPNAQELKQDLAHLNELEWPDFKVTDDPRITRPGRWLRKTSFDELPQLVNVLLGQLSLVGPRPTNFMPHTYELWQTERLDVTPGISGLWQLYGRGLALFDARTRLDIAYVQKRCLWLDLQILLRTIPAVLTRRGAK